jgi:hypothetical protein
MSTIHAKGIRLSIETEPGSGEFRDVAEITDFQVPLRVGRDSRPMSAETANEKSRSLLGGRVHTVKATWTATVAGISAFNDAINRYVEAARKWQSFYAKAEAEGWRAHERATRVRPLRKKIKRFGRKKR